MHSLLALVALLAIGDRGPRVVDVRDFGASPTAAPSVNRKAFHDAMTYLASTAQRDGTPWGTVYVPSGRFPIDRPILCDRPYINIQGEGYTSVIWATTGHDALTFGFKRDVGAVDLAQFPDCFTAGPGGGSVLDATAAPGPGRRWALRTMAKSHLSQQGGAIDVGAGDGYRSVKALTIDAKVDFGRVTAKNLVQGCLFGITEDGHPRPFNVNIANGSIVLQFRTVAPSDQFDEGTDRQVVLCPIDAAAGWVALSMQIDLTTGTVAAWRDGSQLKTATPTGAGWGPGLRFATNEHCPFGLGINSPQATRVADVWGSPTDLTFAGFKVEGAAIYKVGDPGSAQARVDGRPITDALRYFTRSNDTIGYLPLTDRPESIAADRIIGIVGKANLETTGYWVDEAAHGTPYAFLRAGRVHDLAIGGVSGVYGRGIASLWTGSLDVRDCAISSGHQAIGCINGGANYPVTIRDCDLKGSDAAVYLHYSAYAKLDNLKIDGVPRASLRFVLCHPVIKDVVGRGATEYLVKSVRGGFNLSNGYWDDEGPGGASRAAFYASAASQVDPMGCRVVIADCSAGNTAPGRPLIVLGDDGHPAIDAQNPRGVFDCRRLMIYNPPAPVVLAGDRWSGSISADQDAAGLEWVRPSGKAAKVRAVVGGAAAPP